VLGYTVGHRRKLSCCVIQNITGTTVIVMLGFIEDHRKELSWWVTKEITGAICDFGSTVDHRSRLFYWVIQYCRSCLGI
jgi:hypothetical protein